MALRASRLFASHVRVLDGGMGVLLPKLGMPKDPLIWSARALVDPQYHPVVVKAHTEFIEAGASAIIANSYAVIPGYLKKKDLLDEAPRLCALAGKLAREAAEKAEKSNVLVLGSLPPLVDSYRADLLLPEDEAVKWYAMMSKAMAPYVDKFVCETMSCPEEARYALQGIQASCPDAEAWVAFTVDSSGVCRDGTPFNIAVRSLMSMTNVKGIGVNCCLPEVVDLAMSTLEDDTAAGEFAAGLERIVYANAYPKEHSEGLEYDTENFDDEAVRTDLDADRYASAAVQWATRPALPFTVIGGCCGILPHHIHRVSTSLQEVNTE